MRVAAVVPAVVLALALGACSSGTADSSLTKQDVVKKLTVNPPPKGIKLLTKADCTLTDKKNRYKCSVVTEDNDTAKLVVQADGKDIRIVSVQVDN